MLFADTERPPPLSASASVRERAITILARYGPYSLGYLLDLSDEKLWDLVLDLRQSITVGNP